MTAAGVGEFWGVAAGNYEVAALETAVGGATVTVPSSGGTGTALPVMPPGVVRGTVWLDANGDSQRQAWESPLAGMSVLLNG